MVLLLLLSGVSVAQQFPLVLTFEPLHDLGISQDGKYADEQEMKKTEGDGYLPCYYYGDGGYAIKISPSFLQRFTARGFTRQSLCLGLISHSKYDPENGQRLPTYIVVSSKVLKSLSPSKFKQAIQNGSYDAQDVSDEMPFELPNCFRNANPYTDCQFRFGRLTGKKLTGEETDIYRQLGAAYDRAVPGALSKDKPDEIFGEDDPLVKGFLQASSNCPSTPEVDADGGCTDPTTSTIGEFLLRYASANVWAKSSSFPRGYGYALDAYGGAGEDVDPASVKAVSMALGKPTMTAEELRRILAERH